MYIPRQAANECIESDRLGLQLHTDAGLFNTTEMKWKAALRACSMHL